MAQHAVRDAAGAEPASPGLSRGWKHNEICFRARCFGQNRVERVAARPNRGSPRDGVANDACGPVAEAFMNQGFICFLEVAAMRKENLTTGCTRESSGGANRFFCDR